MREDLSGPLIGITQRLAVDARTLERRDALAKDWETFFDALGVAWLPLPNIGEQITALAERCRLTGIILSGGEDKGIHPERDATETALLEWAAEKNIPVAGVCRGLQYMQQWLGGELVRLAPEHHVATVHAVRFADGGERMVNSYHNNGILALAKPLEALAVDDQDSSVEAARGKNLLGVMWHPERYAAPVAMDIELFAAHFGITPCLHPPLR